MPRKIFITAMLVPVAFTAFAQYPSRDWREAIEKRYDITQPVVDYLLTVNAADTSSFAIEMKLRNVPDTFHVVMVAHPEYDDRYWRYVKDFFVETKNGRGKIIREDSALWKITTNGNEAVLHYKIHLPASEGIRSSWKAFLTPTGGLVGGPHSFMYVVGATLVPSHITLDIPAGWDIVTGLQSTSDPKTFYAPSVAVLVDGPIFIGKFKSWSFTVDNTPHRLTYWPLPNAVSFDTTALLSSIQKLVRQAALLFGGLPYREFNFMLQDGAFGSLEHNSSVTVGAPADQLANGLTGTLSETAHEYFHTWNLVRIHPAEYGDVDYKTPPLSKGLWFSEGLTMFYADLLLRRAGIAVHDSTRIFHLENLLRRYFSSPVYTKFSAEKISLASYGPIGMLGDYSGSTHLQGEVLGALLDMIIRNATDGKHSIDDVMRKMLQDFSAEKGFTSKDIEQTVAGICGCDVGSFFRDHVYDSKPIDFNKYLRLLGLQYTLEWKDVLANDGKLSPDLRVYMYQLPDENIMRIAITNPASCWGKAGLHTGDIIKTANGKIIVMWMDFRSAIRNVNPGDTLSIEVERKGEARQINVLITGYQQPVIHITQVASPTEEQQKLYRQWIAGDLP